MQTQKKDWERETEKEVYLEWLLKDAAECSSRKRLDSDTKVYYTFDVSFSLYPETGKYTKTYVLDFHFPNPPNPLPYTRTFLLLLFFYSASLHPFSKKKKQQKTASKQERTRKENSTLGFKIVHFLFRYLLQIIKIRWLKNENFMLHFSFLSVHFFCLRCLSVIDFKRTFLNSRVKTDGGMCWWKKVT